MEAIVIYLLKSSALITVFYLAYHFLVRKETFFTSNRWFLLSGLLTSLLLPFFVITKIVVVEKPQYTQDNLSGYSQTAATIVQEVPILEPFDWMQFIWISYTVIVCALIIKILMNFTSLFRLIYKQQVIKNEKFKLINLNDNIAPFSFFNYIVFNADLYSKEELESILLHEKIHSQERHSIDVLVAKFFCVLFWFNPFVWLYKKAITQNLEYIADHKAMAQLEDKKSYQRALLKVVSHQSCLSLTNNFYQSLIKKRIIMLNKNQSHKRNSWKYAIILPALLAFVILFQIKIIAQEKETTSYTKSLQNDNSLRIVVDKNSTDAELKAYASQMKDKGITLRYSKVKRNSAGEITGIKLEFKDKEGNKGVSHVDGNDPIKPIQFYKNDNGIGFRQPKQLRVYASNRNNQDRDTPIAIAVDDSIDVASNFNFNFDMDFEVPEVPEAPEAPEVPEAPEMHSWKDSQKSHVVIKTDGDKKPVVIINGKVLSDDKEIEEALKKYGSGKGRNFSFSSSSDGDEQQIFINGQDIMKIKSEAMANANIQMKKMRPMMQKQMEAARSGMAKARAALDESRPEMEAAKAEMRRAKDEMIKAKAEMQAAKAEYEKAKADLSKDGKK